MKMEISVGELTLRKLQYSDIELVRQSRNSEWTAQFLVQKDIITKEEQVNWFLSIDWDTEYYWIFEFDNERKGLIYISYWNKNEQSAQTNIFIFHQEDSGHPNFVRAMWVASYLCFNFLHIKTLLSIVHKDNHSATELDKFFGFKVEMTKGDFIHLSCNKNDFMNKSESVKSIFFKKELQQQINEAMSSFKTDSIL